MAGTTNLDGRKLKMDSTMWRKVGLLPARTALPLLLCLFGCAQAEPADAGPESPVPDANALILASRDVVASATSFEILQVTEKEVTFVKDGKPLMKPRGSVQSALIQVEMRAPMTVRQATKDQQGQDLILIRRGDRMALKLGNGAWQVPSGPYAGLSGSMANPFSCPAPHEGPGSPRWHYVGTEDTGADSVHVVETVGDSAVAYAEARIRESLASMSDPMGGPATVKVKRYTSRHRIAANDHRRLRVEQTSHMERTVNLPDGSTGVMDIKSKLVSTYRQYGEVRIQIPDEALMILDTLRR